MNTIALFYKDEKLIELRDDHFWTVINNRLVVLNSNDPGYYVEIYVPGLDSASVVEVRLAP